MVFPRLGDATSGLDPDGYGSAGLTWYSTGRFEYINKAPLYPGFVALVSWLAGGYSIPAVQVGQALLSALSCLVLYAIFRRTLGNVLTARLAGLACAVFPMTIWYIPRLWTETFLTLALALLTLAFVMLAQKPGWGRALLAGAAVGAAALSKGIALAFLPLELVVLAWLAWRRRWPNPLGLLLAFTLAALAFVGPWTYRNYQLTGGFLPIHTDGGYNFYLGNGFARHFGEAPGSYVQLKALTVQDMEADYARMGGQPSDPVQDDRLLLRLGLEQIGSDLLLLPRKLVLGALMFWYLAGDTAKSLFTGAVQIPVLVVGLLGLWRGWKKRDDSLYLLLPVIGIMGVSMLVFSFARLAAPVMPYVIAWAVKYLKPE
jgi:4-amino-4-deoxy-L-arabinose transferase-like glycosyltransferase